MTRTLLILWELFKKNTPRNALIGNVAFFGATAVAAGLSGPTPEPALWIPGLCWITLMGVAGGAAAFNLDLSKGGIRFLEYLPVRRWHVWVADVADGYFWSLLFAIALTWHRTLTWTPPAAHPGEYESGLMTALFGTRFTLMGGAASLTFCAFGVAAFFRLAVQRESAALFRTMVGAVTTILLVALLPLAMLVTPSLADLRLPLLAVGVLYLGAGLFVFLVVPPDWGYWRRAILVTWPLTLLLSLLTLAVTAGLSVHWSRLDPADVTSARPVRLAASAGPVILLDVQTGRSAGHLVRVDTRTGDWLDLGRGLTPVLDPGGVARTAGRGGDVLARTLLSPYGTVTRDWRTVRVSPDAAVMRGVLPAGNGVTLDGVEFEAVPPAYTTDGAWSVLPVVRRGVASRTAVLVADGAGRVVRRLPSAASGTPLAFDPDAARLLYRTTDGDDTYRIHDVRTGRNSDPIRLPGRLVACAADLSVALCVDTDDAGDAVRQSVSVVDLRTRASRQLISPDEMPTLNGAPPPDYDRAPQFLTPDARRGYDVRIGDLHMLIDPSFRRAVWYILREGPHYSRDADAIRSADLRTGRRVTLVPKSDLAPPAGGNGSARGVGLLGFAADASAAVVEIDGRVERIDLDPPHRRTVLARRPDGADFAQWSFSPTLRHVLCSAAFKGRTVYEVSSPGGTDGAPVRLPDDLSDGGSVDFFDEGHLVVSKAGRVYLTDLAGRHARQIFGPPDEK